MFSLGTLYKHTIEIMSGTESGVLIIPIEDDNVFEPTQILTATIESTDPSLDIGPNSTITISILDDEGIFITTINRV